MFNLFRSQKQAVKIVLGAILSLVAVSMVITMIPGSWGAAADANQNVLAEVGDPTLWWLSDAYALTIADVQQALPDAQLTPGLAVQTIEEQIMRLILLKEAEDLSLTATEQELADWLKIQMPFLFSDGVFQPDQYRVLIAQRFRTSIPRFEEEVRRSLMIDIRLRRMVVDGINVSEEDLKKIYRRNNAKTKLRFLKIQAADFRGQVNPEDSALRAFYKDRQQQYTIPESRAVKLMTISTANLPKVEVAEKEIERYYRQNRQQYQVDESIRASHILLMTEGKSEDEKIALKQKAEDVRTELRGGGDFATLAKEYSEDAGTADKGGDLGWVTRGQMVPSFEKASFALTAGEMSEVISTEYGYHIIKVHEQQGAHFQSLGEVREEVRQALVEERQYTNRMQHIDRTIAAARQSGKDLESTARILNLEVAVLPKVVRKSPPAALEEFETLTSSLFAADDGDLVTATQGDKTAIAVVAEIVQRRPATFEEVRAQVENQYIDQESARLAEERASELSEASIKDGLQKAARRFRVKSETSDFVRRQDKIPALGMGINLLGDAAFTSVTGNIVGPIRSGNVWAVYEVVASQEADMFNFPDKRDELLQREKARRQGKAFDIYRGEVLRRFEQAGRVRRYQLNIQRYAETLSGRG